jgi:hypothetical protein
VVGVDEISYRCGRGYLINIVDTGWRGSCPPAPAITGISPSLGPTAGGTSVTITGTGFTGATHVAFGAVAATSFNVASDTQITAVSPAQAAGPHHIIVTGPGGTSALVSADVYTYH